MKEKLRKFAKISNYKILAICLLLIVGIMYYYENIKDVSSEIPTKNVIVVKENIPENTVIEKEMLALDKRYEADATKEIGIAITLEEIVGKRTIVPLYKGETIKNERITENKEYMNEDINKKQISFQVNEIDQALNLKNGEFIDMWVVPINFETGEISKKIFEKLQIVEVVNTNKKIINENSNSKEKNKEDSLATYIVLQLTDEQLHKLYDTDMALNSLKLSRYKKNNSYDLIKEKLDVKVNKDETQANNIEGANDGQN